MDKVKVCSRCVMDTTATEIVFDDNGVCNYCHHYDNHLVNEVFSNNDGYVYRMESGTSRDGDNVVAIYESLFMPITDPQKRKTFYKLDLYIKPFGAINIDCNIRYNQNDRNKIQPATFSLISDAGGGGFYGNNTAVFGTTTYGEPRTQSFNNNIVGSGNTVALRIEDDSSNSAFLLDTAILEFAENNRK